MPTMTRSPAERFKFFALLIVFLAAIFKSPAILAGGSLDLGIGFGAVNHRDGFDGGWAYKVGYEFGTVGDFHAGLLWHGVSGLNDRNELALAEDLSFRSNAVYATFRPTAASLEWLQFSTGLVLADYRSSYFDETNNTTVIRDSDTSRAGFALGIGIVLPVAKSFRLHLLDYHRYWISGETFDIYGISITLWK